MTGSWPRGSCVYHACHASGSVFTHLNYCTVICAHHSGAYGFSLKTMTGAQNKDGGPLMPHHKLGLIQLVCVGEAGTRGNPVSFPLNGSEILRL